MALSAAQLTVDLRAMIADAPVSVTFGAVTKNGTESAIDAATFIQDEGRIANYRRSVSLCKADWTTSPTVDDNVTVGGVTYIVLRHADDEMGVERRLDLGEENAL